MARPGMANALRGGFQSRNAEFFAIGILRLHKPITVANQHAVRGHPHDAFHVGIILHDPEHDSALIQVNGLAVGEAEAWQVSRIGVAQRPRRGIEHSY